MFNIVGWKFAANGTSGSSASYYVIEIIGSTSFLCLLGSRMFINLKEAGDIQANGRAQSRNSLSSPAFASPIVSSSGMYNH